MFAQIWSCLAQTVSCVWRTPNRLFKYACVLPLCAAVLNSQTPELKRRIAVFDFDNAAVRSGSVVLPFYQTTAPNLGQAVSQLLINRLVNDGEYAVIERTAIDKVFAEQNLSNSDRSDPVAAARIGRVLGVDCIILGSITQYDYADKVTGGPHHYIGGFGGGSTTLKHDISADVQISARVVSAETAEILAVSQGQGHIFQKGVKVDARDNMRTMQSMSGTPGGTVMSDATDKAIVQLTTQLNQTIAKVPARSRGLEGKVADVDGERLIVNVGSRTGVKMGDRMQIWRPGKPIRDPDTGKVLRYDDKLIGTAVVSSIDDLSAVAQYTGQEAPAVGDRISIGH